MSHPVPSNRVLPTLNNDGTRRWVRPKPFKGRHYKRRLIVAWGLIGLFFVLPWINVGGHPSVLLDIPGRKFYLFGLTFLPTDTLLLMLALLATFLVVFWLTALFGRVWCGWACPQTLYLEFVFRPIEQFLEGSRGQQQKLDREGANSRRVLKYVIYAFLALVVANVFLAYFVGVERLQRWLVASPLEQPVPFFVVLFTTALVFFDFAYFREQMCTIICPYARLQSVLLDKQSLLVGYDEKRGEPRGKGRSAGGDCIDCHACVVACPTGIDIRKGLQLECIACTQCVDACDQVMTKIKKPIGLIRYGTQLGFEDKAAKKKFRPRIALYPALILVLVGVLVLAGGPKGAAEVTVLRGMGAPFTKSGAMVQNQLRIKIQNRGSDEALFRLELVDAEGAQFVAPQNPLSVSAGEHVTTTAFVIAKPLFFEKGVHPIKIRVTNESGFKKEIPYKLLGPMQKESL